MPFVYNTSLAKLHFPEDTVYEVQDVYSGKTISGLKTGDSFSVVINPSGVVMWYLYPTVLPAQPCHVGRRQARGEGFQPFLL
ncbi:alpha-N-acetylgalactosaminidase [Columba livia]